MASKRKSTVPCMIPSKSKHMREEIILGCLPELLPTIPEDSILSISGEESSHFSHNSSRSEGGNRRQKGGTYSCPPCRFESTDLNYFLDHMHNFHADFRTQPTFYCLNCGVSVVRFETLALHNAKAHPGLMGGLVNASLHVKRRDGLTAVEQSLFTDSGEDCRESGISLTKTPIVKMMKGKGEHKKIVVSHTVEVRKMDTGKETDPGMLTNVPELQNGALGFTGTPAMTRTPVGQMVTTTTTTVANQVFHHQHTPSLYSSPCDSNRDLPKVMIPLSSIPTYDAAMDTSSFLKTSFGKFPYPTKAELCYLTVVSEFPEEQIKLWFTAQRLKQGISWSPEEIEEARRKMFNTVFQGGAPQKQPPAPRRVNHIVTHHTVTGQPAHLSPMGPNCPMAKVPHGSLKGRPVGILGSQPNLSTNPQVTRVSYTAPALPPKFPTVVRTTQVLNKNTAPTLEPDKSIGLSLDMAGSGGCVSSTSNSRSSSSSSSCSSSSSISSYSSSSNGGETVNRRPMNNSSPTNSINSLASCSTNISNNDEHCLGVTNGMQSAKRNGIPLRMEGLNGNKNKFVMNNTSKSNIAYNSYDNSRVGLHDQNQANKANDDRNNNYIHKPNNSSISSDYSGTTCNDSIHNLNHASKTPNESTSTTVITKSSSIAEEVKCTKDFPIQGMSILQQLIKEEDYIEGDKSAPELKVDPIKINLKRLKMNELDTKPGSETVPPELKSTTAEMPTPLQSSSAPWGTKTPQQVHVLRQVFSGTHWPSSQQYEELSIMTGLPKSEVVRWFSDSRYVQKNGQLKWLESYQCLPTDPEEGKGRGDGVAGVEVPRDPLTAQRQPAEQDTNKQLEGGAGLSSAQRGVWQDTYTPLLGLMGSEEAGGRSRTGESVTPGVLQDPWSERTTDDHQQPVGSHPFMEQQTEASQTRDHLRMELLEV